MRFGVPISICISLTSFPISGETTGSSLVHAANAIATAAACETRRKYIGLCYAGSRFISAPIEPDAAPLVENVRIVVAMKTRAAVAWEAGKLLVVEDVELAGPKAGEVLVEISYLAFLSYRRVHALGRRSRRALPGDLRPRGRGCCARDRRRRHEREPGDHVVLLYTPECRQCKSCLVSWQDEPLHGDPRDAGQRHDAGRHEA